MANVKGLQITFSWEKPLTTVKGIKDTSTLGYYVRYKNLESSARRQVQSSTEQKSLRLNGNARYEIQVKAYKVFNDAVAGPWSDPLTLKRNESGKYCAFTLHPGYWDHYHSSVQKKNSKCKLRMPFSLVSNTHPLRQERITSLA